MVLDPELGLCAAGRTAKDAGIVADIYDHTVDIILQGTALGGYLLGVLAVNALQLPQLRDHLRQLACLPFEVAGAGAAPFTVTSSPLGDDAFTVEEV